MRWRTQKEEASGERNCEEKEKRKKKRVKEETNREKRKV